jgi:hypothetical protein
MSTIESILHFIIALIIFMTPLVLIEHHRITEPVDPLTALFYEVSARQIEPVNCSFTHSALQHLPDVYQMTFQPSSPSSPLHRAVYVFLESTLHRWATNCL